MRKKFRGGVGTSKAKSVIKKGESSSSNPKSNRHRLAAKSGSISKRLPLVFFDDKLDIEQINNNELTQHLPMSSMNLRSSKSKSLENIEADESESQTSTRLLDASDKQDEDALTSISQNTAKTELTQFTSCTNPTFDPVHREWKSGSKLHFHVITVLAAVSDIIRQNNGTESDSEYFGALLTCMDSSEDTERIAATAYLLFLTTKKIPKSILVKFFSQSSKIICEKLELLENRADSSTALKFLISGLGFILTAQPLESWEYSTNKNILALILRFANNSHPWVRNMSRRVLRKILIDPLNCTENGFHPASKFVGELILKNIQVPLETKQQKQFVSRSLCLLGGLFYKMPKSVFRPLAESILQLGTSNDIMLKCSAFQCLQKALLFQPNDFCLTTDTNIHLIIVLRNFHPINISVCAYWFRTLIEAHICLAAREELKSLTLLNETLEIPSKLYRKKSYELSDSVHYAVTRFIQSCIQQNSVASINFLSCLYKSLDYDCPDSGHWILATIVNLVQESQSLILGEVFNCILKELAEIRDSQRKPLLNKDIENLFEASISYIGLVETFKIVSLNITGEGDLLTIDIKRTWLLPLIIKSVRNASLQFFLQYFVPLTIKIKARIPHLSEPEAKLYTIVEKQIWTILSKIVSKTPIDFYQSFPALCSIIGAALNERKDLRLVLLSTIRAALSYSSCSAPSSSTVDERIMQKFAKNFMPILFSIYVSSGIAPISESTSLRSSEIVNDQSVQSACLETIKLYADLIPNDLLIIYITMAIEKIQDDENSLQKKTLITDILTVLCRVADSQCLFSTMKAIKDWFTSSNIHLQKKAYKLLAQIYQRTNDSNLSDFFDYHSEFINDLIAKGNFKVAPSSWSMRINIFCNIINTLEDFKSLRDFADSIFNEVLQCLDRTNSKPTKTQSTKCLQAICVNLVRIGSENDLSVSEVLDPFLEKILMKLTQNAHENQNTIKQLRINLIALAIVCSKNLKLMNASSMSRIVTLTTEAISVKNFETRALALRLIRILIEKMPNYCLTQYKETILSSIFTTQPCKISTVRVRKANLLLFEVLVEKFTIEHIMRFAESRNPIWVNHLKNMEKILRRRMNKLQRNIDSKPDDDVEVESLAESTETKNESDSDEDDEENDDEQMDDDSGDENTIFIK